VNNWLRLILVIVAVALASAGCKSQQVTGGTSKHDAGGFTFVYQPPNGGKATITDNRDSIATTQPSVTVKGDQTHVTTQTVGDGQIGGVSFDTKDIQRSPTAWGLIGLLLAAGVGFYLLGNRAGMILCGAGVVLAFVYPAALVWIALAAVLWLIVSHRDTLFQIIDGTHNALGKLPHGDAATVKTELEKAQSPRVKRVVAEIKSKLRPAAN
jgi:hypothetical protein